MSPLRTGFVLSLVVSLVNAAYVSPAVQVPSPLHNSGSIITAGDFNGDTILDFIVGSSPGFTDYAAVNQRGPLPRGPYVLEWRPYRHSDKFWSPS
jgi:hypothetical protein